LFKNINMEESTSSVPMLPESSTSGNTAPEPRRSGRVRLSTQRFESTMQPATSAPKPSVKRKRSDTTNKDKSNHQHDAQATHAQVGATKPKAKATTKRVANNKSIESDDANAKPSTKARPSEHARNVIDLTEDDEPTSSKKPKKSKSAKDEEKRLRA
jgi:hypothetical protein